MNAENFALDYGTNTEVIEHFGAVFPWVSISIFSNGLIIETIHSGDLSGLVISSQEGDVSWILQFKAKQKLESLNWVESSVYEVTHKDISRVWDFTALIEKLKKIMELSMDISADSNWRFDWLDVTLLNEDLLNLFAQNSELSLWKDGTVLDGL